MFSFSKCGILEFIIYFSYKYKDGTFYQYTLNSNNCLNLVYTLKNVLIKMVCYLHKSVLSFFSFYTTM